MGRRNWALASCAGAVAVATSASGGAETPSYSFTPLDFPGATRTVARGINDAGQIVGFFSHSSGTHGFLRDTAGEFTPIDVRGASSTEGRGINTAAQIVGDFTDSAGKHGFLDIGGRFTPIDVPGATASFGTFALGINDANQIVGDFFVATGQQHGSLYQSGEFTTIDFLGVMHSTAATGINNAIKIIGYSSS